MFLKPAWRPMVLPLVLAAALCVPARADDDRVGSAGDFSQAQIEGCQVIGAAAVRSALAHDVRVQVLSSPSAPRDAFLGIVQMRLRSGYEDNGFPNAQVTADVDATGKHLVIHVVEGVRYMAGAVRVEGGTLVDAKALAAALTEPTPAQACPANIDMDAGSVTLPTWHEPQDQEDAVWVVGKPAGLAREHLRGCRSCAVEALYLQGLCWAKVRIEPDLRADGTADLVVRILDEGPRAVLADVKVKGLRINSAADVLKFVGLDVGMPINLAVLRSVRQKLWDSGRFLKHEVRADAFSAEPGRLRVTLDLIEHPKAPPLGTPIESNPSQAIALKTAGWFRQAMADHASFIVWGNLPRHQHLKLIVQDNEGVIMSWRQEAGAAATRPSGRGAACTTGPASSDMSAIFLADEFTFCSSSAGRKFSARGRMQVTIKADFFPPDDPVLGHGQFQLNWGITTRNSNSDPPVKFECTVAPVVFLDLLSAPDSVQTKDGVMTVVCKSLRVRIDPATGRLIELAFLDEHGIPNATLTVEAGALDRELASLQAVEAEANDYDPKHPVSTFVEFLERWYAQCPPDGLQIPRNKWLAAGPVVLKLVGDKVFGPLDQQAVSAESDNQSFDIPVDAVDFQTISIFRVYLCFLDDMYPHGSWPWTIGHEGVMALTGGSPYLGAEVQRLISSADTGPICCAVLAGLLRSQEPRASRLIAQAGLGRLTADRFGADFDALFRNDGAAATVAANLLQGIADLSDADFADLAPALPAPVADVLAQVRKIAKEHPKERIVDVLHESPQLLWDQSLGQYVSDYLKGQAR